MDINELVSLSKDNAVFPSKTSDRLVLIQSYVTANDQFLAELNAQRESKSKFINNDS